MLQWGRASGARKACDGALVGLCGAASMGPCFGSTEGSEVSVAQLSVEEASMGPCFGSTEGERRQSEHQETWDASMGPCFGSTEGGADGLCRHLNRPRFNGAVLREHGRQRHPQRDIVIMRKLQWGRASGARKAPWDRPATPRTRWASMGPCFGSTEGEKKEPMSTRTYFASMGPCFGSTEGRRTCNHCGRQRLWLQSRAWG